MFPRASASLLLSICLIFCSSRMLFGALSQWEAIEDGIEILKGPPADKSSGSYLRVSLDRFDVRVATPRVPKFGAAASSSAGSYTEHSARGLLLDDYIARYNAVAAISAGYVDTFSPPTPLGQIKSDGITIGTAHSSWATEGVFCSDKGRAIIKVADSAQSPDYRDCLQVGPILLLDGAVPKAAAPSGDGDYNMMINGEVSQAMVCIDGSGRLLLGLAHPTALAKFVAALQQQPIRCKSAIRLQPGGMRVNSDLYGVDKYLHPSALVVIKR